ncbi:MAG: UDP-N-acetylglucosamine-1-phosphate transferase [Candidatus Altiarchaeota archaeon]
MSFNPLNLIEVAVLAFGVTLFIIPYIRRRLIEKNYISPDYYKRGNPMKPTYGGIVILVGVMASLILAQFYVESGEMIRIMVLYFIAFNFAILGLVDDLLDIPRPIKFFLPLFIAMPIALLNIDPILNFGSITFKLNFVYPFIISPIYVMVVANLVNMHSGYNGLAGGLTTILLGAITIKAYLQHGEQSLFYVAPILGALLAFMIYNLYPTQLFMGNIGSMLLGSITGALIVALNMEYFGFIILIPHTINFLLFVYWKVFKKPWAKYGTIDEQGHLKVPNNLTLKWVAPYYYKMTELQATLISYGYTILFCIIGLFATLKA